MPVGRKMNGHQKILYAISAISTSGIIFVGGYFMGLQNCKSFAEKLKDFLF